MKNRKGFTLIELLAVVVVIGILLLIAVPSVSKYLNKGTTKFYNSLEKSMVVSGREYLNDYQALLPKVIGNVTVIELNELTNNNYMDEVKDSNGNVCEGKITVKKIDKNQYDYYSCLICEDYQTEKENCEYSEDNNINNDTKNYTIEVEKDKYIVKQGEIFELPYAKAYYLGQLVSSTVSASPRIIDTNKLGTVTVTYAYEGVKKRITVEVIDASSPSIPQIVLKEDNENGKVYNGNWYKGNIYAEYKSTDYTKPGLNGSGIKEYQISQDGINYSSLNSNNYTSSSNGEHSYYVRSVDNNGNISESNIYSLKIDKELPKCELQSSGTKGSNGWYTSDAKLSFKSITEKVSSIKSQSIDNPTVTSDVKDKKVIGTVIDQAGNPGECQTTVSVDKTNPTVSYNLSSGNYSSNKTVTVTASDTYYSHMQIHVYKNGSIVNGDNNITSTTKSYNLTNGTWTIYTKAYDQSGRKQSQSPENSDGWYYQSYLIDTIAPTCSLKVTSGTQGSNGWYTSNVTVGWDKNDGTGSNISSSIISQTTVTAEGTTTVTGTITDEAGNIGTCSISISIEKTVSIPTITYNGGANSCSWKNNYNLTLSSSAKSGIAHYEIDWDNNGTVDTTTGNNFIPWNGYNSCNNRFRAVSNAGNRSNWTAAQHIHMDTGTPGIPTITYNGGANSCSWKNNYNLTLTSTDNVGIAYYEIDTDNNGTVDATTGSNFIPSNGWSSCSARFRGVDHAGNRSEWTAAQHIHMDTEKPKHTNWWWGTVTKDKAPLYIQVSDNVGISKVQCPTSTATGGYTNWHWFDAVWDASANAYRCDITPATFGHYGQSYKTHLYIYDHAGNGGYYNQTSVAIPASCVYAIGEPIIFNYTGGQQTFDVKCDGNYKLEVWGAQGGYSEGNPFPYIENKYPNSPKSAIGGLGGYAVGNVKLTNGTRLNIVVGGQGGTASKTSDTSTSGGYNGGGLGVTHGAYNRVSYAAGGGGATHIATATGLLSSLKNNKGSIYIVAGGGGGSIYDGGGDGTGGANNGIWERPPDSHNGYAGGGTTGSGISDYEVSIFGGGGGTQSSGGTTAKNMIDLNNCIITQADFGQGAYNSSYCGGTAGGGGGYYGGGASVSYDAAGGGSGYLNPSLTSASMQNGVREGHGYATITYLGE